MSVTAVLALIAGLLFLLSLIPATNNYPLTPLGGLLLSIAVFLIGR